MRPNSLFTWFSSVRGIKGVGDARAKQLDKIALNVLRDLAWHFPVGVVDRSFSPPLSQVVNQSVITTCVTVDGHRAPQGKRRTYQVEAHNETGRLTLTYFHVQGDYLTKSLPVGSEVAVSGTVEWFGNQLTMPHPDYVLPAARVRELMIKEPVYSLTAGISNKVMRQMVEHALGKLNDLPEWHDEALLKREGWPTLNEAVACLHKPEEEQKHTKAKARLVYDELLANQLGMRLVRGQMQRYRGVVMKQDALAQQAEALLPYKLTDGQKDVLKEIAADMQSGERMLRLLQGDVGSGKTVVALLAMLRAVEAGYQAAMMAPTDIVARQHYHWASELLQPLGIVCGYLSGAAKAKNRKETLEKLASGEIQLLFGTHALFQEKVQFHKLGMVVVDEQHRFGVEQRLTLIEKGQADGFQPHVLLMSATPIPRSLTMAYFGDLDSSRLSEKPPGRQVIDTRAVPLSRYAEVVEGLGRAMAKGAQIYWVCPLVEESEKLDIAAVTARIKALEVAFPGQVAMVHGRVSAEEKQKAIARFAAGEKRILVATTVIEVGVNVPSATIMVIEHAERFGLAQLHQLRGRVGRGSEASSCILMYEDKAGETARERLKALRATDDGFAIAEEDLRLRGGGELLGTKQSGVPGFRFADMYQHREMMAMARDDAKLLLGRDPKLVSPRGQAIKALLYFFEYDKLLNYSFSG
ncbi:ATP-dependent DNA helicase RecG [bacterium]|nr:ATP-dependent DNA helicase RecG [bacterium]